MQNRARFIAVLRRSAFHTPITRTSKNIQMSLGSAVWFNGFGFRVCRIFLITVMMRCEHMTCLFFYDYTWSCISRILPGWVRTSIKYFVAHSWSLMEAVAEIYLYEIAHDNCMAKEDWIKCHKSWFHESNSVHFNLICFEVPWLFSFFSCLIHMQAVAYLYLHRIVRDSCKAQEDSLCARSPFFCFLLWFFPFSSWLIHMQALLYFYLCGITHDKTLAQRMKIGSCAMTRVFHECFIRFFSWTSICRYWCVCIDVWRFSRKL